MEIENALKQLCKELEKNFFSSFEKIDFSEFKDCQSILIFRSANIGILREFLSRLESVNVNIKRYVITHSSNKAEIAQLYGNSIEIIEYCYSGNYDINNFGQIFDYLNGKCFDKVVILYNNRFGTGYENVEQIVETISTDSYYAFNSYLELYKVNNLALKKESAKLYKQICNWYWEYLGLRKGVE